MRRLERVLERNLLTCGSVCSWKKEQGYIYRVGTARIYFLSGQPSANIVGATASTLLVCDEAQDVSIRKWDKEINPMAASTNATRVFWGRAENIEAVSSLIYVYPGWQTYSVDLRSLELVSGSPWNTADWATFRIDPIANGTGQDVTFYIDDIKLTGDERADLFADIRWELTDPDSSATTMDLYYDTDSGGLDGTFITTLSLTDGQHSVITVSPSVEDGSSLTRTLSLTQTVFLPLAASNWYPLCTGACYTWDTHTIAPGTYYLYTCMNDGYNELCRYSERPLLVDHP